MKIDGKDSIKLFNDYDSVNKAHVRKLAQDYAKENNLELSFDNDSKIPAIPSDDDYYEFPFRHISATVVGAGSWKATDFSEGNVLKKSTSMLFEKPAYLNHELYVGNEIGYIGQTKWTNAYTNSKGDKVPGGIDAPFVIDSVLHRKIVRKMNSKVSPISSASVTILFGWEASHDFEHEGDFYWHLGEEIDGEMVRRIVKEVYGYEESSLVWSGADPYAKMLDAMGEVTNIDKNSVASWCKYADDPLVKYYESSKKYFVYDCLDSDKLLHLNKTSIEFSKKSNKAKDKPVMNKDLLKALALMFNTTVEDIESGKFGATEAKNFVAANKDEFEKLKTDAGNYETVNSDKEAAEQKVQQLEKEVTELKKAEKALKDSTKEKEEFAKIGEASLTKVRDEAVRLYGVFAKGEVDEAIEDELKNEQSLSKLEAKIKLFGGKVYSEFGAECNKCHSTDIKLRSSKPTDEDPGDGEQEEREHIGMAIHSAR